MESLFAGEPQDLTAPGVLWHGDFRPVSEIPPPVRHAAGYARFAAHVVSTGDDPSALADDLPLLVRYLRRHRRSLEAADDDLLDSAGMFLGNTFIARVDDGRWQHHPPADLEVTQGHGGGAVVLRMVRAIIAADDDRMREFDDVLRSWDEQADVDRRYEEADRAALQRLDLRRTAVVPDAVYRRPPHGSLVDVLRSLIDHLTTHYVASVTHPDPAPHDPHTISPTVELIGVAPGSPFAAPLLIAIDDVGAVALRAGAFTDLAFFGPDDADLEAALLAIAAGLFRETCSPDPDGIGGYRLGTVDGAGSTSARGPHGLGPERRDAIAATLAALPDGWEAWPLRPMHDR